MPPSRRTRVLLQLIGLQCLVAGSVLAHSGLAGDLENVGVPGGLLLIVALCFLALGRQTAAAEAADEQPQQLFEE